MWMTVRDTGRILTQGPSTWWRGWRWGIKDRLLGDQGLRILKVGRVHPSPRSGWWAIASHGNGKLLNLGFQCHPISKPINHQQWIMGWPVIENLMIDRFPISKCWVYINRSLHLQPLVDEVYRNILLEMWFKEESIQEEDNPIAYIYGQRKV